MKKEKYCPTCKVTKSLNEFYKSRSRKDGVIFECKICAKESQNRFRKSERGKEYIYNYKRSESNKVSQKKYCQSEKGQKFRRRYEKKWKKQHQFQRKAQSAITSAIAAGRIPRASLTKCTYCPNQAEQYHHYLGYDKRHWFDVKPTCRDCHRNIHFHLLRRIAGIIPRP